MLLEWIVVGDATTFFAYARPQAAVVQMSGTFPPPLPYSFSYLQLLWQVRWIC